MKQEKKRIRSVGKYHFENVKVCVETDVVFTRCRVCKQLKPSNLEYFRKDSDPTAQRLIQPLCKECGSKLDKEKREMKKNEQKPITNIEQKDLFQSTEEMLETKVDRILSFLGLNRGQYKK